MDKVRRFLWQNFGVTLNRQTIFLIVAFFITCIAAVLYVLAPEGSLVRFLLLLLMIPGVTVALGGSYRALWWGVSSKKERAKLEVEVALKQWKAHAEATKTEDER